MKSGLDEISALLGAFLRGDIVAEDALARWPGIDQEKNTNAKRAWHTLIHYIDDADIRADDPSYGEAQKGVLRRYLEAIDIERNS